MVFLYKRLIYTKDLGILLYGIILLYIRGLV